MKVRADAQLRNWDLYSSLYVIDDLKLFLTCPPSRFHLCTIHPLVRSVIQHGEVMESKWDLLNFNTCTALEYIIHLRDIKVDFYWPKFRVVKHGPYSNFISDHRKTKLVAIFKLYFIYFSQCIEWLENPSNSDWLKLAFIVNWTWYIRLAKQAPRLICPWTPHRGEQFWSLYQPGLNFSED